MYCRRSHSTNRWARAAALVAGLAALGTAVAVAAGAGASPGPGSAKEYQVKAAFLYNFGQFVEWPASAFPAKDAPLVIAVLDPDPFDGALDRAVAGKSIAGHPIVVKHVATEADLPPCHVLFVPSDLAGRLKDALARVARDPVLTVGESDAFLRGGGVIRFYLEDGRVRFEIDPDAADRAGLKISSKLLSLARIYKG